MSRIVVFSGPPLSGKSTLSAAYGIESNVPVMEMDSIRLRLIPDSQQSARDRNIAYESMHHTAEQLLLWGAKEVALVATYTRRDMRRNLVKMSERCKAQLYILQFRVASESANERFMARPAGHAAVDLTSQSVRDQAIKYPYYDGSIIIDTTNMSAAAALGIIIKYLNREDPLLTADQWVDCARETGPRMG